MDRDGRAPGAWSNVYLTYWEVRRKTRRFVIWSDEPVCFQAKWMLSCGDLRREDPLLGSWRVSFKGLIIVEDDNPLHGGFVWRGHSDVRCGINRRSFGVWSDCRC